MRVMAGTGRRRLRLAAGLTLLVLAVLILIGGTLLAFVPGRGELFWILIFGEPTLFAAIAVLRGGTKGGAFGGLISLVYVGLVMMNLVSHQGEGRPLTLGLLVMVAMLLAYAFAAIASFLTIHARDKPPISDAA